MKLVQSVIDIYINDDYYLECEMKILSYLRIRGSILTKSGQ